MLVEERRRKVLELVRSRGFVALSELAGALSFSESTLRRDLDFWDEQGELKRTHGGAMYVGGGAGLPALEDRATAALAEKRRIARAAAHYIGGGGGGAILLDGGTTTLEVAKELQGRGVQIVTNSLPIAQLFASRPEADLVFLGGYIYPRTGVALGPLTVLQLQEIHVRQAILSVGGITAKGLFNSNLLLVETERAMMRAADEVVVVVDSSKIGRPALAYLCGLDEVDTMIVDDGITAEQQAMITDAGAKLIVAGDAEQAQRGVE